MKQEFVTLPREAVERAMNALEFSETQSHRLQYDVEVSALAALGAALEQSQVEQEPVGEHDLKDVRCECCGYMTHHREHMGCIRAAHTKREPLTDDQVLKAVRHLYQSDLPIGMGFSDDLDVARAIEAAHNIK